jgi:PAS domain S-box-containing protein
MVRPGSPIPHDPDKANGRRLPTGLGEDELHQVLDSVPEAIMATHLDGTIFYWNQAAERLYGWRHDEVLGRNVVEVTPADATKQQAEQIMLTLKAGRSWEGEFQVQRKDGSTFPAYVKDSPLQDNQGRLVGIVGVSRDRTQEVRMQELEKEAAAAEAQADALRRRESERQRIIQDLAHEVNNPLTPIRIHVSLLRDRLGEDLGEQAQRSLDIIDRSAHRTRELLQSMYKKTQKDPGTSSGGKSQGPD